MFCGKFEICWKEIIPVKHMWFLLHTLMISVVKPTDICVATSGTGQHHLKFLHKINGPRNSLKRGLASFIPSSWDVNIRGTGKDRMATNGNLFSVFHRTRRIIELGKMIPATAKNLIILSDWISFVEYYTPRNEFFY